MGKRKKNWSKIIEVEPENLPGVKLEVCLYERTNGASVYYSFRMDGKKVQKCTKRSDRDEAEEYVTEVVKQVLKKRLAGRTGKPVTPGEVFTVYFRHRGPQLSERWRKHSKTRSDLFLEAWGESLAIRDLSPTHVESYVQKRRSGAVSPFEEGDKGRDPCGYVTAR